MTVLKKSISEEVSVLEGFAEALIGVIVERTTAAQQSMSSMQEEAPQGSFSKQVCHCVGEIMPFQSFSCERTLRKEADLISERWLGF